MSGTRECTSLLQHGFLLVEGGRGGGEEEEEVEEEGAYRRGEGDKDGEMVRW